MSKTNRHRSNRVNGQALSFMKETLKWPTKTCFKPKCPGTMIPILVQYKDHGIIHEEWECTECSKTIKDPRFPRYNRYQKGN